MSPFCVLKQDLCKCLLATWATSADKTRDNGEPEITIPYYIGLQPYGFYDWELYTVPQDQLDGASRRIPMGKGVGGGTLINGMVWNRGNQESFNSWGDLGNSGWSWDSLLPYFIRVSTCPPILDLVLSFGSQRHSPQDPTQIKKFQTSASTQITMDRLVTCRFHTRSTFGSNLVRHH